MSHSQVYKTHLYIALKSAKQRTVKQNIRGENFWPRKAGPKKTTLLVLLLVVVVINSLKIPNAFLIRSGAKRNLAHTFRADIAHRSTDSDFSLIL